MFSFEEKNNEAISLGFNDIDEMNLFHDICGFDIIPSFDREELLERCNDESRGRTKDEFIEYMQDNDLVGIYNRVKDLNTYERFIELYDTYTNEFMLTNFMLGKYNKKWQEAADLFDGEKQDEYQEIRRNLFVKLNEITARKNNLEISSIYRLEGQQQFDFYKHVEEITDYMDEINRKGRGRKH